MNIPKVILEMEGYRKRILTDVPNEIKGSESSCDKTKRTQKEEITKITESLKTIDFKDFASVSERVVHAFTWVLEVYGYDEFRNLSVRLKKMNALTKDQYSEAKGELAELFLFLTIKEWIRIKGLGKKWRVYHHFWLPYRSGKGSTELDVVLASPSIVVVFECKSYNGLKQLKKEGLLTTSSGKTLDIFKQNALHCKALWEHIEVYSMSETGVLKSVFFDFSFGETNDLRTPNNKTVLPMVNEDNLIHFLNALERAATRVSYKQTLFPFLEEVAARGYNAEEHMAGISKKKERREDAEIC